MADTLETRILTFKALKDIQEEIRLYNNRDTSVKANPPSIVYTSKNMPKFLTPLHPKMFNDTTSLRRPLVKPKPVPVKPAVIASKVVAQKKPAADTLKSKLKGDTVAKKTLSDTSRIRIVIGHHNAKVFKSDLQAKSDSLFWSSSDSTIRCYVNPIIWTQGSQLSGDTINMQLKNKKLDNLEMYPTAFIVNIEKNDSLHFNQVSGKRIYGTFKNNKLNSMVVTGNAETIYFKRDTVKNVVTEMNHTTSPGLSVAFKNGQLAKMKWTGRNDLNTYPIKNVKEEDKVLKNFIWKPKERPASKEAILSARNKPKAIKETAKKATTAPAVKPPVKNPSAAKTKPVIIKQAAEKTAGDSVKKDTTGIKK